MPGQPDGPRRGEGQQALGGAGGEGVDAYRREAGGGEEGVGIGEEDGGDDGNVAGRVHVWWGEGETDVRLGG